MVWEFETVGGILCISGNCGVTEVLISTPGVVSALLCSTPILCTFKIVLTTKTVVLTPFEFLARWIKWFVCSTWCLLHLTFLELMPAQIYTRMQVVSAPWSKHQLTFTPQSLKNALDTTWYLNKSDEDPLLHLSIIPPSQWLVQDGDHPSTLPSTATPLPNLGMPSCCMHFGLHFGSTRRKC